MPMRAFRAPATPSSHAHRRRRGGPRAAARAVVLGTLATAALALAGCADTPAPPHALRPVPAERIVEPALVQPAEGRVAVDVRRERSRNLIVGLRDAPLYVDGQHAADLMNGEHVVLYLAPGLHRIGVTTQFDPLVELRFVVDPRYTNRASVSFDDGHHIQIRRVAR